MVWDKRQSFDKKKNIHIDAVIVSFIFLVFGRLTLHSTSPFPLIPQTADHWHLIPQACLLPVKQDQPMKHALTARHG